MAALVASRSNPVIAAHYQKLRSSGKAAKQALTACIRKLIVIINAILRDRNLGASPLDNKDSRSGRGRGVGAPERRVRRYRRFTGRRDRRAPGLFHACLIVAASQAR
jgi:hypothetical protein